MVSLRRRYMGATPRVTTPGDTNPSDTTVSWPVDNKRGRGIHWKRHGFPRQDFFVKLAFIFFAWYWLELSVSFSVWSSWNKRFTEEPKYTCLLNYNVWITGSNWVCRGHFLQPGFEPGFLAETFSDVTWHAHQLHCPEQSLCEAIECRLLIGSK